MPQPPLLALHALFTFLEVLLPCVATLLIAPVVVLYFEVLAALTIRGRQSTVRGTRPTIAVLMPAHNEASGIAGAIRSILPQLSGFDQLLVVADNCSDDTAAVASTEGARVVERFDTGRAGKGYALDFGVWHLRSWSPEVVIVIDADCQIAPGTIDTLARVSAATGRPVQALYLMHTPPHSDLSTRIAQFAWVIKNQVRPLGLNRLDLPCQMMGTGMAFPWPVLAKTELATGNIVEDIELGISCTRAGTPPLFCPEALVTSPFPTSLEGIQAQRTRWEHGHIAMILSEVPRMVRQSVADLNPHLMALALDLSVPPLSLLALELGAAWLATFLLYYMAKIASPLYISTAGILMLVVAVSLCWVRYGRHVLSSRDLAYSLIYGISKIPLYAKFFVSRQTHWVRSKRD